MNLSFNLILYSILLTSKIKVNISNDENAIGWNSK